MRPGKLAIAAALCVAWFAQSAPALASTLVERQLEAGELPDVLDGGDEPPPKPPPRDYGPRYRTAPAAAPAERLTPRRRSLYREGPRYRYLLDGRWYFRADPESIGLRERWQRDHGLHPDWHPVAVPYAFNAGVESDGSMIGAVGWYRRDFRLPDASTAYDWLLRFESVSYRAKVWLNGHPIGNNAGAWLPFKVLARGIARRATNRLVIRVDSRRRGSDLPPFKFSSDGRPRGGWWNYGGILREVYLERVEGVAIDNVRVRPELPCASCPAEIAVRARLLNYSSRRQRVALIGSFGGTRLEFKPGVVGPRRGADFLARLRVDHPRLWSPAQPNLYKVWLKLNAAPISGRIARPPQPPRVQIGKRGGARRGKRARRASVGSRLKKVSSYSLRTGIRSIRVDEAGTLRLNGQALQIRGVGIHEDHPTAGAALTPDNRSRMMGEVIAAGANLIRSHYPLHPHFQEIADRNGVMVWSEIPMYGAGSSLVKRRIMRRRALKMLGYNIEANGNRPSVIVWSIGNELASLPKAAESQYFRAAANLARRHDPSRLVGLAITGYPNVPYQPAYAPIDVIGINDYFGWYAGPGGSLLDRTGLGPYLDRMRADYPDKALLVSEFGAEANRDGPVEEKGTYEFQRDFIAYHLDRVEERPWLAGAAYWTLGEFRVRPGWSGGNPQPGPNLALHQKGLLDFNRTMVKPAYAELQRRYKATPALRP